jgi:hypothetical protein
MPLHPIDITLLILSILFILSKFLHSNPVQILHSKRGSAAARVCLATPNEAQKRERRPIATVPHGAGGLFGARRGRLRQRAWLVKRVRRNDLELRLRGPIPRPLTPSVGGPSLDATVYQNRGPSIQPSLAGPVSQPAETVIGRAVAPSPTLFQALVATRALTHASEACRAACKRGRGRYNYGRGLSMVRQFDAPYAKPTNSPGNDQ